MAYYLGARMRTELNPILFLVQKFQPLWEESYLKLYKNVENLLLKGAPHLDAPISDNNIEEAFADPENHNELINLMLDKQDDTTLAQSKINDIIAYSTIRSTGTGIDFSMSIVVLPDPQNPEWTYLLFFGREDWYQMLLDLEGVEEYSYDGSTDFRLEELGQEEIDSRFETWNRLIGNHAPSEVGFLWEPKSPVLGIHHRMTTARDLQHLNEEPARAAAGLPAKKPVSPKEPEGQYPSREGRGL